MKEVVFLYKDEIQAPILDLGCGNSKMLEYFYEQGFKNLYGVDFATKIIEKNINKYSLKKEVF